MSRGRVVVEGHGHLKSGVWLIAAISCFASACAADDHDASPATTTVESVAASTEASAVATPEPAIHRVDGRNVSMPCNGTGSIPVVLLAGGTDPHTVWDNLVDALGSDVLTCRFDPPGLGASDPPSAPTTASRIADVLAQTLLAAGLDQPVVLVAHSLGGQTARQFGARHPDMLAGAVLLDPTTRLAMRSLHENLAADGWQAEVAITEAEAQVTWPDVPLVVLSHDPTRGDLGAPAIEQLWSEGQAEYAALSAQAHLEVVAGSGHYVYVDAPAAVVEAISEMLTVLG